jgi:hypothetical protein
MNPGKLGEGVALLNDHASGRAETRRDRGEENVGARHYVVGVNDGRICSEQIVPAKAFSEILLREPPEGVAGLDCYYVQFRRTSGCGT